MGRSTHGGVMAVAPQVPGLRGGLEGTGSMFGQDKATTRRGQKLTWKPD